ncbi:MAG: hypothetical protein KGL51_06070, partial [Betaproteobacteria bacterium]|nr:hypothetical protein [Betaproteobacteria bacterium]
TATGAGAVSRFNMGLVIATGLSIGTLFTLFVVPAMYMMLGADHSHEARAKALRDAEAGLATNPPGTAATSQGS